MKQSRMNAGEDQVFLLREGYVWCYAPFCPCFWPRYTLTGYGHQWPMLPRISLRYLPRLSNNNLYFGLVSARPLDSTISPSGASWAQQLLMAPSDVGPFVRCFEVGCVHAQIDTLAGETNKSGQVYGGEHNAIEGSYLRHSRVAIC